MERDRKNRSVVRKKEREREKLGEVRVHFQKQQDQVRLLEAGLG